MPVHFGAAAGAGSESADVTAITPARLLVRTMRASAMRRVMPRSYGSSRVKVG